MAFMRNKNQNYKVKNPVMAFFQDLGKASGIAVAISFPIGIMLFLVGAFSGEKRLLDGLEIAKNGLFFMAAIVLFLLAGMMMIKTKNPPSYLMQKGWRKQFQVMSVQMVMVIFAIIWVATAAVADYFLLLFK